MLGAFPAGAPHAERPRPGPVGNRLRGRDRGERGQALVEFALVLPLLMVLVLGIVQFASTYNNYIRLTDSVRIGGRAAATQAADLGDPTEPTACAVGIAAAQANLSSGTFTCTGVTVAGATADDPGVRVTGTYPYSISILGIVVMSGQLTSRSEERLT